MVRIVSFEVAVGRLISICSLRLFFGLTPPTFSRVVSATLRTRTLVPCPSFASSARKKASLPCPNPLKSTSREYTPHSVCFASTSLNTWNAALYPASYPLLALFLKPAEPPLLEKSGSPFGAVNVMIVLLRLAFTCSLWVSGAGWKEERWRGSEKPNPREVLRGVYE